MLTIVLCTATAAVLAAAALVVWRYNARQPAAEPRPDRIPHVVIPQPRRADQVAAHHHRRISPNHPAGSALPGLRGPDRAVGRPSGADMPTDRISSVRGRAYLDQQRAVSRHAKDGGHN